MKCRKNTSGQVGVAQENITMRLLSANNVFDYSFGVAQENITMRLLSANNVLIIPFRHINFSLRNAPHGPCNVKP